MSQAVIAGLIPMNQSNYSKIERDLQEPNIFQLKRICQILNLDPAYLLELNEYETLSDADLALLKETKELIRKYS